MALEAADALRDLFSSMGGQGDAPTSGSPAAPPASVVAPRKLQIDLSAVLSACAEPSGDAAGTADESTAEPEEGEQATPDQHLGGTAAPWKDDAADEQADPDRADQAAGPTSRKQAWTQEEDTLLLDLINQHGPSNWSRIAAHLSNRIGKQCRERWHNHLSPEVKKESFSREEDMQIMRAVAEHGTKWALIVKLIPGRTDNAIKNRWNSTTRKMLRVKRRCGEIPGVGDLDITGMDAASIAKRMLACGPDWCLPTPQPPAKRKLVLPENARAAKKQASPSAPAVLPALDLLCRLAEGADSDAVDYSSPRLYEAALLLGTGCSYAHSSLKPDAAAEVEV